MNTSHIIREEKSETPHTVEAESTLNRDDDSLPYGYYNPASGGSVTWICGEDAEGRITSVFANQGPPPDKLASYIDVKGDGSIDKDHGLQEAKKTRKILVDDGWQKIVSPKITFTYPNARGEQAPLNRKQKRALKKKMERMNQQNNPFMQ